MEHNVKATVRKIGNSRPETAVRPVIRLGAGSLVISCLLGFGAALWPIRVPKVTPGNEVVAASAPIESDGQPNVDAAPSGLKDTGTGAVLASPSAAAEASEPGLHAEPTPEARRLVESLVHVQTADGNLTPEQVSAWKQNLQQLVQQGPIGVSAIHEFLAQNIEYNFSTGAGDLLGYGSARTALLDALVQIGGAEAVNTMTAVLQTAAEPREIALLALDLEKLEPGQHRDQVMEAARQTLEMATTRKLEMPDVAPLFEVLQKFGGEAAAGDLEKATQQWNYYGTIALAQLPDDAGIPKLVQMAQNPNTTAAVRDATLQVLAEVSDRSAEARAALLTLARMNLMSPFTWQMVASTLAGDQVALLNSAFENRQALPQVSGLRTIATSDNQNFFAVPGNLTPEQASQRVELIDELLSGTNDPAATQLLQQSRTLLSKRFAGITR